MRLLPVVLLLLVLTACSGAGTDDEQPVLGEAATSVDVSTTELAEQKAATELPDCPDSDPSAEPVEGGLPAVTLPCLGGGRDVNLAGLDGRPVVLNLWANYCQPCRDEMPLFERLHKDAGDRLLVLGLDFQDQLPSMALALANQVGVSYPSVADPEGATRAGLQVMALPQTVLVDADGRVVATVREEIDSYQQLKDLVEQHLQVAP